MNAMISQNKHIGIEGGSRIQDITYMRILRVFMRQLAAWPSEALGEVKSKLEVLKLYIIYVLEIGNFSLELVYIINNAGRINFLEIGHTYITIMVTFVAVSRQSLVFTKIYKNMFSDFVFKIHLNNFKMESQYEVDTHALVSKVCHFFTLYLYGAVLTGVVLFNMTPLYNNYVADAFSGHNLGNVTFQHSVYYALPFDYTTEYEGYIIVFCINWFMCYTISSCVSSIDLFMSLVVFHVWGHLRIICHKMENFHEEMGCISNLNYVERNKLYFAKLRDIIIYHQLIIKYISMMSKGFGSILLIYYGFHQVSGCLLLLECSEMTAEALLRYFPLTLVVFQQLIQLSIIFELLGSMTDKLTNAAYLLPWESMDTRNQKLCHILLRQAQAPLRLKALDMIDVGVTTMTAILKTSFSYFIMLRTIATEDLES